MTTLTFENGSGKYSCVDVFTDWFLVRRGFNKSPPASELLHCTMPIGPEANISHHDTIESLTMFQNSNG